MPQPVFLIQANYCTDGVFTTYFIIVQEYIFNVGGFICPDMSLKP